MAHICQGSSLFTRPPRRVLLGNRISGNEPSRKLRRPRRHRKSRGGVTGPSSRIDKRLLLLQTLLHLLGALSVLVVPSLPVLQWGYFRLSYPPERYEL